MVWAIDIWTFGVGILLSEVVGVIFVCEAYLGRSLGLIGSFLMLFLLV